MIEFFNFFLILKYLFLQNGFSDDHDPFNDHNGQNDNTGFSDDPFKSGTILIQLSYKLITFTFCRSI